MTDLDQLLGSTEQFGVGESTESTDAALAKVAKGDPPAPPPTQPSIVELMRGLEGTEGRTAEVRELNGFDEEAIARYQFQNPESAGVVVPLNKIAELATVHIGGKEPTAEDIESMLVGDRNTLVMAIRRLTYGSAVEGTVACGGCFEVNEVIIDPWTDLEFIPWDGDSYREIELRNGRRARFRLMTAGDQRAAFAQELPIAERNSVFLERMVMDIDRQNLHIMPGEAARITRQLGLADRKRLLDAMAEQPGYQFGREVDGHCASCGTTLGLRLEVADLLQG